MTQTSLASRVKAAQLPPPAVRRAIRVAAGATLQEMRDELASRGIEVSAVAVLRWETGRCEPRRDRAIAYRELLEELRTAVA